MPLRASLWGRLPPPVRRRLLRLTGGLVDPAIDEDPLSHPERLAVLPYVTGRCLEVGCGHRKTADDVVGVDLVPGGRPGSVGNVAGRVSQADVAAHGEALPFSDLSFDSLIARHNLEHYVDTVEVLREWCRVLRPGGTLAVIVPDEEAYLGRTLELDPTHYHAFTQRSLSRLVELVGFARVTTQPVVAGWSFLLVARKPGAKSPGRSTQ